MMRQLSRVMFVVFLLHTVLIAYSAFFWSKEIWAFISGGLFYIIFGAILVGQWGYIKFFKKGPIVGQPESKEEWFDLVDEKGKVIGKAPRHAVHGNPALLHPTVHLHVFNDRGQLFLQKRSQEKDLFPGYWDTAVGGHVSSGESIEQALVRESKEELGIDIDQIKPLYRYVMRNRFESELVHTFEMLHNGPFELNQSEIEDGRFWSGFEIRKMIGKNILTPNFEQEFELLTSAGKFQ
jgi:isopentenyl-diphosphate delta-isomerase type 1